MVNDTRVTMSPYIAHPLNENIENMEVLNSEPTKI